METRTTLQYGEGRNEETEGTRRWATQKLQRGGKYPEGEISSIPSPSKTLLSEPFWGFFHAQAAGYPRAELERPGLLQPRAADEGSLETEAGGGALDA